MTTPVQDQKWPRVEEILELAKPLSYAIRPADAWNEDLARRQLNPFEQLPFMGVARVGSLE